VGPLEDADTVVSDSELDAEYLELLRGKGIEVLLA
jgi:DeoR/GlpR family transcriptional regulator of sugar metabolism